ncbi:MAG: hypothetical protein ACD_39C00945G0002 [uncultured bacterium]|nr:MAG: hypothetical protein ACD_39C00945G0002 [uncultured bacterium]
MKAECENFILLLQEHSEIVLDEAHKEHLTGCQNCRRLLESHDRNFGRLKSDLLLSEPAKAAIFIKIQKMITEDKISENGTVKFSLPLFLHNWRLQIAFTALLVLFVAGLGFWVNFRSDDAVQISGTATIFKNFKKITLENATVSLNPGEQINLVNGQIDISWHNSERVAISGMLDFNVQERSIVARSGQASLTFLPAAAGYLIKTRLMLVKVLGTTVMLELTEKQDSISVIKGKVEWSLLDGTKKCEVGAGTRMTVKEDLSGLKVIEDVCSEEIPENSSQSPDLSGSQGARKIGNKWVPLEKN